MYYIGAEVCSNPVIFSTDPQCGYIIWRLEDTIKFCYANPVVNAFFVEGPFYTEFYACTLGRYGFQNFNISKEAEFHTNSSDSMMKYRFSGRYDFTHRDSSSLEEKFNRLKSSYYGCILQSLNLKYLAAIKETRKYKTLESAEVLRGWCNGMIVGFKNFRAWIDDGEELYI